MTAEELERKKFAQTDERVLSFIRSRWSPRAFSSEPVTDEDLATIMAAASWAASSYNEQPWRFLLGRQGDSTYAALLDSMISFNAAWAASAPVLLLSVAQCDFTASGKANSFAEHDTGAATAYLGLQATALGLHTHSMAGFDQEAARRTLGIPYTFVIGAITALGKLGDPLQLPEKMQGQELAPRTRKPQSEFVFSAWKQPWAMEKTKL